MPPPLLTLDNIHLTFGGAPLFEGVGLIVEARARIALVGRNGSGKSTLVKIAAGRVEADKGSRFIDPSALVGYLEQEPDLSGFATVGDYVEAGLTALSRPQEHLRILAAIGLEPERSTAALSGGQARRAAIARTLSGRPNILLLDEPTNHLDLPAIEWLEKHLASSNVASVIISHDRRFLEAVTTRTVWIDRGGARQLDAGFAHFEAWRDKTLEEEEQAQQKLDRKILREEHWVRYGVTARRKRNVRRMEELSALRQSRRETRRAPGAVQFAAVESGSSGKRVIVAEKISKRFGDEAVIEDFSIEIGRGDRIGLVGPNGAGKTTLLRLLTGELAPDSGAVRLGAALDTVKLDQQRATLEPGMRLVDAITDGRGDWVTLGDERRHVASYLEDFLFAPEQWRSPVGALSGGERGRLALAVALAKPSNLLVLDEPTNDLDLETLDLLQERLSLYSGTLLLVSHDRAFLDQLTTSIVAPAPEGGGRWLEYVGGYDDMVRQRGAAPTAKSRDTAPEGHSAAGSITAANTSSTGQRLKLSYKEKFALEQLPARIASLEASIGAARARLADPGLFSRDPKAFAAATAEIEKHARDLAAAEEEWLALELKREAIEG